jgi:hypothetical protein
MDFIMRKDSFLVRKSGKSVSPEIKKALSDLRTF